MQNDSPENNDQTPPAKTAARRRRRRRVPDTSVPSPCVAVCRYNDGDLCEGCFRTPDEIRDWIIMNREEKLDVLAKLAQRRKLAAK